LNDIVRQLTIIATIFLPLTAVTGFFGMNFEHIPWNSPLAFILTTLFILAIPVVMLRWFRRWGWLEREPSFITKPRQTKVPVSEGRPEPFPRSLLPQAGIVPAWFPR